MIFKILNLFGFQTSDQKNVDLHRNLIRKEAEIGSSVFGPIPYDRHREFFCLDKNTWIWHEEWTDERGQLQSKTTRYDVRPDAILKAQNNGTYHKVGIEEARNLQKAAHMYQDRVLAQLYGR